MRWAAVPIRPGRWCSGRARGIAASYRFRRCRDARAGSRTWVPLLPMFATTTRNRIEMTDIDSQTLRELPQPALHAPARLGRIKELLPWLIWALLLACSGWIANRTAVATDVTAFLPGPATRTQALLATQLRDGVAARLILIGIEAPSVDQAARAAQITHRLAGA